LKAVIAKNNMENDSGVNNLSSLFKILIFIIGAIIVLNLVYIDIFVFNDVNQIKKELAAASLTPDYPNQTCPNSCLSQIHQATISSRTVSPTIAQVTPSASLKNSPTPINAHIVTALTSQAKELFIPLGNGTNSSEDWEDVMGLKVSIDSSNFPSVKSIVFEASVNIPTGNEVAYVRLFNETDKHPVWYSDVSLEGGIPQLLTSKPITLDSGNKIYKVQMKTSLKYQAILTQARIHIITK
jgi:hypothetical protein